MEGWPAIRELIWIAGAGERAACAYTCTEERHDSAGPELPYLGLTPVCWRARTSIHVLQAFSFNHDSIGSRRFSMTLLGLFAGIAFVLAAVGVYGVISYSVSQRTQEIGIRVALGSGPGQVVRLIVREGMTVTAIGAAAGLAMAIGVTRTMSSLLFGLSSIDVPTYAIATGFLTLVALAASYGPATRAAGIDPAIAVRQE